MVPRRNPNYNMTIDLFLLNVIKHETNEKKNQNCRPLFPVEDNQQQSPRAAKIATSISHAATWHEQQRHNKFLLLNARGIWRQHIQNVKNTWDMSDFGPRSKSWHIPRGICQLLDLYVVNVTFRTYKSCYNYCLKVSVHMSKYLRKFCFFAQGKIKARAIRKCEKNIGSTC